MSEKKFDPRPPVGTPMPTIGRTVLVRWAPDCVRPGIVSKINDDGTIGVHVFVIPGMDAPADDPCVGVLEWCVWSAGDSDRKISASWHWPPRAE